MDEASVEAIRQALEPIGAVRVAYLFGSRQADGAHPDSDLDLAVAFETSLGAADKDRAQLAIVAALTDALGAVGERTDVVDLADASSAVAFKAIQGALVLARDGRERRLLEVRVARRYDDDAKVRALYRSAARRRWATP